MSTTAAPLRPTAGRPRATDLAFRLAAALAMLALALLVARFFVRDALKYVHVDPATFGDFWPRRIPLMLHVAAGSVALFAAPLQLWTGARRIALPLHRWTGRAYVAAILLGAGSALYLAWKTSLGWPFGAPLALTALLWLAATGIAVAAIRNGRVKRHREWMVRSYALTLFFVWIRGIYDLPVMQRLGPEPRISATAAWISLALALAGAELVIRVANARGRSPARVS